MSSVCWGVNGVVHPGVKKGLSPAEMEEVLGSSDVLEGQDEEQVSCETDRSSAERTPWLSISS